MDAATDCATFLVRSVFPYFHAVALIDAARIKFKQIGNSSAFAVDELLLLMARHGI